MRGNKCLKSQLPKTMSVCAFISITLYALSFPSLTHAGHLHDILAAVIKAGLLHTLNKIGQQHQQPEVIPMPIPVPVPIPEHKGGGGGGGHKKRPVIIHQLPDKHIQVPIPIPIPQPYPLHIPREVKLHPVPITKHIPFPITKRVPYPVPFQRSKMRSRPFTHSITDGIIPHGVETPFNIEQEIDYIVNDVTNFDSFNGGFFA